VCCADRARGGGEAAARHGQGGRGLEGLLRSDAAVVGYGGRARGGDEAAVRYGQGVRGLEGQVPSYAVVVGMAEREPGGRESAAIFRRYTAWHRETSCKPPPHTPPHYAAFQIYL